MEKKDYDVIIVGAGLGGLKLANLLNDSKLKVLLIEKRKTITSLTKNYFGTFREYIERWNLEKYMLYKCGWGMYTKNIKYFNKLEGKELCILEMNRWAKSLRLECDIKKSTEIIKIRKNKDSISVIDNKYQEFSGKIVVDATGISQVISGLLGIKRSKVDFLNYIYIMENHKLKERDEMFYFQDADLTNCGGWFHTLEKGRCLVGCAEYTVPESLGPKELKKRLDKYITSFDPLNKYLKNAKIKEEICMAGPTTTEHSSIAEDNYISIGDAAGAGGPFIGDGFRMAFAMADSAHETIKKAFKKNDFSKRTLKTHSKNFKEEFGKWYKWSYLLRFIWTRYLTNKEFNVLAARLKKISDEQYYSILTSKLTAGILFKIFSIKATMLVMKNAFIYHMLEPLKLTRLKKRPQVL